MKKGDVWERMMRWLDGRMKGRVDGWRPFPCARSFVVARRFVVIKRVLKLHLLLDFLPDFLQDGFKQGIGDYDDDDDDNDDDEEDEVSDWKFTLYPTGASLNPHPLLSSPPPRRSTILRPQIAPPLL